MGKAKKKKVKEVGAKFHKRSLERKLARVRNVMAKNKEEAAAAIDKVAEVLAKHQATEAALVAELAAEIEVLPPVVVAADTLPITVG